MSLGNTINRSIKVHGSAQVLCCVLGCLRDRESAGNEEEYRWNCALADVLGLAWDSVMDIDDVEKLEEYVEKMRQKN